MYIMNYILVEFFYKLNVFICRVNYRNIFKYSNKYVFINYNL